MTHPLGEYPEILTDAEMEELAGRSNIGSDVIGSADLARFNRAVNDLIRSKCKMVYACDKVRPNWLDREDSLQQNPEFKKFNSDISLQATHQTLVLPLVEVEQVECKHEHFKYVDGVTGSYLKCEQCDVQLIPTQWEPVKESK